ncbi:MAG: tetratricopeptide repeat protein [Acidobacteriota bacterium]
MPPFSPERWRLLSPFLDEALDVADHERAAWLASICARDAALGADLQLLLSEHRAVHQSGFLDGTVPLVAPSMLAQSLEGQTLGAYRLVSLIGQGGMGSVWLAERSDGRFEGRAAVKLLNIALVGRAGEERFRHEGSILARLTHPHIAHLIDAGVSPSSQPYLVLEHVDGQHIDRYCEEHALGIEARLRVFLDVLEAVAHAHSNLIVHRDIKPANVIVSVDGQVKLLDFGIAKLLEPDAEWGESPVGEVSALTREAGAALTPEYAAPEQLAGEPVTTATDVYALGVLLYVLLSGQHPAGAAVRSPAPLIRAIVDVEPRRVSDAVVETETAEALTRHAARCGTTPARLRRTLRGDLDVIVGKALKKQPAERYPSVTALADDIRRYLRHEPISARPDTLRYRAATFARRHARSVAMSAAVVLLLTASTAFYTYRLATERDRARREAAKATVVSELLTRLLTAADPYATRETQGEPTARALLDARAAQAQRELAGQPELQAEILTAMGRTYRRLGDYDKAQPLLEQALASAISVFGTDHVFVAQALHELGVVLAGKADYAAAATKLERALDLRRTLLGPEHPDVAITLSELGRVYQDQGRNQAAEPLHREALRIRTKVLGEDGETAVSMNDLGSVLRLKGDLAGAEDLIRRGLALNRKTRGEDHPNTATSMQDLGLVVAAKGDLRAAESLFREALARLRAGLGERHPLVAATLNNLARVLLAQGRLAEASAALDEALNSARRVLGSEHPLVAIYSVNLGEVYLARKEPARAETLFREGLRVRMKAPGVVPSRRRTFAEDDWSVGAIKSALGASLVSLGRYAEAEAMLLDARGDLAALPHPQARDVDATVSRLADLYAAWGKTDQARAYRALAPR